MIKLIKYLINEGKNRFVTPFVKWSGLVIASYGCYDYGKYYTLINGVDITKKDSVEVLVLTKFQNLLKWIQDGNFYLYIKTYINNISFYLNLPIRMVTIFLILFFSILLVVFIYKFVKFYLNRNVNKKTYTDEVVDIFSNGLHTYVDNKLIKDIIPLENKIIELDKSLIKKDEIIKDLQSKFTKELEIKDKLIKDIQKNKEVKNNLEITKVQKQVKNMDKRNKQLQIKNKQLQNNLKKEKNKKVVINNSKEDKVFLK